jgi:hypothetical protein
MPTRTQILSQLSATELKKLMAWKCPLKGHRGHSGLEHFSCYCKLHGTQMEEKVGFLDIEAEDLKADFGIMFCWKLLDAKTNKMYGDVINLNDIKKYKSRERDVQPKEDTRIVQSFVDKVSEYDRVVLHFGCWYDLPFARTRAVIDKVEFPMYGSVYQTDTWKILRAKFKLSRNSQQNASLKLLGVSRKDHLSLSIKHGCLRGEKWALDLTEKHCENDVLDLRDNYNAISFSVKNTKTSI